MTASALGCQSSLTREVVEALLCLLQDEDSELRHLITHVVNSQGSWNVYRCLTVVDASLLKVVYSKWIIPRNFKQPDPLYLDSGALHFYTPEGLETVPLNEKEVLFKKTILEIQREIGIPKTSQIRIQGCTRRRSSGSYDSFFSMPGAWPMVN